MIFYSYNFIFSFNSIIDQLIINNNNNNINNRWRKEAFPPRQYDPITEYVPTNSVSLEEGNDLIKLLQTNLDGYLGPAYNYDDRRLTEEWMLSFRDNLSIQPTESEIIKLQIESLMDIMLSKIQDQVCNDMKVLSTPPIGLGSRLVERPVWGIDSHTNKMIQLILEDYFSGKRKFSDIQLNIDNDTNHNHNNNHNFTIEEYKIFLERTLLPTINFIPTSQAYSMKCVLEAIIDVSYCELLEILLLIIIIIIIIIIQEIFFISFIFISLHSELFTYFPTFLLSLLF